MRNIILLAAALALFAGAPSDAAEKKETAKKQAKPEEYKALYRQGVELAKKGNYAAALPLYNKALAQKPDSADLYYARGRAYSGTNEYNKAVADLEKAVLLKPDFTHALNYRGMLYAIGNRTKEAEADFKKACSLGLEEGCKNIKNLDKFKNKKGSAWP